MHSANHWGGSLEINGDSGTDDERSRNMEWERQQHLHQHRHLDETQQSWLLGPHQGNGKKKYVDLGCIMCSHKALKYTIWSLVISFFVIALPIIIVKSLPQHKSHPPPPDNYTLALHKALLFFNAQKCKSLPIPLFSAQFHWMSQNTPLTLFYSLCLFFTIKIPMTHKLVWRVLHCTFFPWPVGKSPCGSIGVDSNSTVYLLGKLEPMRPYKLSHHLSIFNLSISAFHVSYVHILPLPPSPFISVLLSSPILLSICEILTEMSVAICCHVPSCI